MIFSTTKPFSFRLNLLVSAAAALLLMSMQARSADITAPVSEPAASQPEAAASAPEAPVASATPAAPRYSASNLERAFNYMDASRDGKVSREEAAGFRGVARNFDRADTDHDNALSRGEFDRAMNYVKPQ